MNMVKLFALMYCAGVFLCSQLNAEVFELKSPDGKLRALIEDGAQIKFSLFVDGKETLKNCEIGMSTDKGDIGGNANSVFSAYTTHKDVIKPVWGIRSKIDDIYNQLVLGFKGFKVTFRAYDDAIAYRISTELGDGDMSVFSEKLRLPMAKDTPLIASKHSGWRTSFEDFYSRLKVGELGGNTLSMPVIAGAPVKMAIVESDVLSYPWMRLTQSKSGDGLEAVFAPYPKSYDRSKPTISVVDTEKYIARTKATRDCPWRAFIPVRKDTDLADNDVVYKLASPSRIQDTSWIEPGLCVWEWWNDWEIEGVPFKAGVTEENYKYYTDYAAEHGIPYVVYDAGWLIGRDVDGMGKGIDERYISGETYINIPKQIAYAKEKGVKVILWILARSTDKYPERGFDLVKKWGAAGMKIDFIERDDQTVSEFYEKMLKLAAERNLIIDFHGCAKPAGIQRTYPNCVNFEAVLGNEYSKFSKTPPTPQHKVDLVFTRMLVGPMDYTPGSMRNVSAKEYQVNWERPSVIGTRANEVAMFVLYFAPLQMMCDSPTAYLKYPDLLSFITSIPTTWDDTKALQGTIGSDVVVARRSGENWFVGGLNADKAKTVKVRLADFLPPDSSYKLEIVRDSINSEKTPEDFIYEVREVESDDIVEIQMQPGGGFAMKFTPMKLNIFGIDLF